MNNGGKRDNPMLGTDGNICPMIPYIKKEEDLDTKQDIPFMEIGALYNEQMMDEAFFK